MIILSIDVGIKNLAYCLFQLSDINSYEILQWNTINLCAPNKKNCMAKCKNNENCPHLAKYHKNNQYYCKTHAKKVDNFIIPTNEILSIRKRNRGSHLGDIYKLADKYSIPYKKPSTKTTMYSIIDEHIESKCFQLIHEEKTKDYNLVDLGKSMNTQFNELFKNYSIDTVLIENQISPIANRMKTLQGMIAQYFIMNDVSNIEFISSMNKLKYFVRSRKRSSYTERKKIGIEITSEIIVLNKSFNHWNDDYSKSKKKDDLADAFLQCIWYLLKDENINLQIPPKK